MDYNQTYASVAKTQTWKIILAIAAVYNLEIEQMDAITAFLYRKANQTIYIKLQMAIKKEIRLDYYKRLFINLNSPPNFSRKSLVKNLVNLDLYK